MTDVAMRVENLSKLYRIGKAQRRHDTLRDAVVDTFKRFNVRTFQRSNVPTPSDDTIWALKDVSFEVKRGEVLGIIGRNGAGKSTLLKILSRITEPTAGRAVVNGRVGSLLEVGTGFHPELTGRENIYLNGAILGMRKAEIERKFDEIVAFAEIEQFLDTPVKHYSSGMYVRLAFAVAAHLEPEILLVDEVLAVGDAQFQKKCLGKMGDVAHEGRTVLFVSHNMAAIQRLCPSSIVLERGRLLTQGESTVITANYLSSWSICAAPMQWINLTQLSRDGTGEARFVAARYSGLDENLGFHLYTNGPAEVILVIHAHEAMPACRLSLILYDQSGHKLVNADTMTLGHRIALRRGRNEVRYLLEALHLNPGRYVLGLWMAEPTGRRVDFLENACLLDVVERKVEHAGASVGIGGAVPCHFRVMTAH